MSKGIYHTFTPENHNTLMEPMFLGSNVNVSRYDIQKEPMFEKLIEKQLSFFWRPEEVDVSTSRYEYAALEDHEQHIFLSNLKYQTLLDSVQGRSPNLAFLSLVSLPELETWIETWSFSETIHSRSYTHIIRNLLDNPSEVFDSLIDDEEIIKRASTVTKHYDYLIFLANKLNVESIDLTLDNDFRKELKKALFLTMISVNVLEGIRFYVSFACSFSFAERSLMEPNAKIIKLIARDEALHLAGTQHIINVWKDGKDDPEMKELAQELESKVVEIYREAAEEEKQWANYLFKDGTMIGLNTTILSDYIEYITNKRMKAIGYPELFSSRTNPLPWMDSWINSSNVQVAPQETEISNYLVGQVDASINQEDLNGFEL